MVYTIDEAKRLVIKAGLELCEAGLVARTWGNISARVSETQYVITPSGRAYDTLTREDIVLVKIADGSYEGEVKPSGEKGVHAAVYEVRPEINFVIHTHQNYASALSILDRSIIPCAKYGMYATDLLVDHVKEQVELHKDKNAVLMKYHGALCYGADYDEAFAVAYQLEEVCKKEYERLTVPVVPDRLKEDLEKRDGVNAVLLVQTPYILKMSGLGKRVLPYLDDVAQIAGIDVGCLNGIEINDKAITGEWSEAFILAIELELKDRNAVLIKDLGAVCTGYDQSEAEAVGIVLEKACMAAYLAECIGNTEPLDPESAKLDREAYLSYYSKLK